MVLLVHLECQEKVVAQVQMVHRVMMVVLVLVV